MFAVEIQWELSLMLFFCFHSKRSKISQLCSRSFIAHYCWGAWWVSDAQVTSEQAEPWRDASIVSPQFASQWGVTREACRVCMCVIGKLIWHSVSVCVCVWEVENRLSLHISQRFRTTEKRKRMHWSIFFALHPSVNTPQRSMTRRHKEVEKLAMIPYFLFIENMKYVQKIQVITMAALLKKKKKITKALVSNRQLQAHWDFVYFSICFLVY